MKLLKFLKKHKIIIILLIIVLIYILYYFFNTKNNNNLLNDNKWLNYRLGDILKGYLKKIKDNNYLNNIVTKLPNSIGAKYILQTKNLDSKLYYNILNSILKDYNYNKPNKDDIVIHLRIGDSIRKNCKKKCKKINNINYLYHSSSKKIYATIIENLEKTLQKLNNNKRCILVYGIHKKLNETEKEYNENYLNKIKELLKKYNFKFIEKKNGNPDEDFYYMIHSNIFIQSGGGYSKIIADIVNNNGGLVYEPNKK